MLYPFSRFFSPARSRSNCGPAARKKRGFNLIETAIVLGVVGLVIGGIWVAAAAVSDSMKVNNFITRQSSILSSIQAEWRDQTLDATGTLAARYILAKGLYQSSEVKTGTSFWAPELGDGAFIEYSYLPPGTSGYDVDGIRIRVWNVKKARCRPVIAKMMPFFKEYTFFGTTYTPQMQVDSYISSCESSGFFVAAYNNVLPSR